MECRHSTHNQTTGLLVCFWDDRIVSRWVRPMFFKLAYLLYSVITPWFTIRKVKVKVEIVSSSFFFLVLGKWPHI
jgi:hypothetical protein